MGLSFFGLPTSDDPELGKFCATMKTNLLHELRALTREVGFQTARAMPTEVRRWWLEQMQKEAEARQDEMDRIAGKRRVDAK